jgi:hypothetical protein
MMLGGHPLGARALGAAGKHAQQQPSVLSAVIRGMMLGGHPLGARPLGAMARVSPGPGPEPGPPTGETILQPSGATFSRKRWLELIAVAAAKARGEQAAEELRHEAARDIANKAIEKARAEVLSRRAEQQAQWAEQQRVRELAAALASGQGLANLQHAAQLANAMATAATQHAHAQQANSQDDDEALMLLLPHR